MLLFIIYFMIYISICVCTICVFSLIERVFFLLPSFPLFFSFFEDFFKLCVVDSTSSLSFVSSQWSGMVRQRQAVVGQTFQGFLPAFGSIVHFPPSCSCLVFVQRWRQWQSIVTTVWGKDALSSFLMAFSSSKSRHFSSTSCNGTAIFGFFWNCAYFPLRIDIISFFGLFYFIFFNFLCCCLALFFLFFCYFL